ncbi:ABC transporter substrate-binding protein [Salidesulfovibrio onnuriiensis]|uniref:ABC transporter substrate-binding protein n=1 Tax=Salidesulfovibrio onnuriiensis TaxID=2583823 RepID=UPI0011CB2B0C|nr:ABC transporter substrate-binding protein [Salidesulfovibrio onnuriiensis]
MPIRILTALFFLLFATVAVAAPHRLAVIAPKSGPLAYLGLDIFHAAHLAVDEINRNGGLLGQSITLVEFDNKSDLRENVRAAEQIAQERFDAVIGPVVSSRALAAARIFQKAGIPMISPGASAEEVTRVGDYIFRSNFTNAFQGRIMAHFAALQIKAKKAAVLIQKDEVYSTSLAASFAETFVKLDGAVVYQGYYAAGQNDFRDDLEKIRQTRADALILPGYDREAALIINQARTMGMGIPVLGGDAWSTNVPRLVSDPLFLDQCYEIRHFARNIASDKARIFLARFEERYGPMQHDVGAIAYDAVLLYAAAVRKAESFDRAKVKNALFEVSVKGVTGNIRFNKTGDPEKPAVVVTYRDGQPVYFMVMEP